MNLGSLTGKSRWFAGAAVVCLVWLIAHFVFASTRGRASGLRTVAVTRGDISTAVSASGTLEPEEVIDVGAQVAGKILGFGQDHDGKLIDYGSTVDEGMILARIDESLYEADAAQSRADLARSKAELIQAQVKLQFAERDWKRAEGIGKAAVAQTSLDAYQAAFETARAGVTVAEAAVGLSQAAVDKAQKNLDYCIIKSPVGGTIIDKRVNIGQTVVSSLNTPSLFLLAKDLTKMQVWVSVNEADIGSIKPGQQVHFTIDAFPGEDFVGTVNKIRLNASMVQNVVTYVVEVNTDNSSKKLLPYLTANARFDVRTEHGVLLVPNSAMRWTPPPNLIDPDAQGPSQGPAQGEKKSAGGKGANTSESILWVPDGRFVKPVRVKVIGSDDSMTEIAGDEVQEGMEIAIGTSEGGAKKSGGPAPGADSGSVNPFAPPVVRGGRRG